MSDFVNLPGGARARRAEEMRRLARMEAKLDVLVKAVGSNPPATPLPTVTDLQRAIGTDDILLPTAFLVHRLFDDVGEYASEIEFLGIRMTIAAALAAGVLLPDGRVSYYHAGLIAHSRNPFAHPSAVPVREPRL